MQVSFVSFLLKVVALLIDQYCVSCFFVFVFFSMIFYLGLSRFCVFLSPFFLIFVCMILDAGFLVLSLIDLSLRLFSLFSVFLVL